MSSNIVDIVSEFSFTYVDIITNGDFLTEKLLDKLVNAGLYKILISQYDDTDYTRFKKLYPDNVIIRDRRNGFISETNRAGTLNQEQLNSPCYYPFYMMMVDWNGDVFPCCQDWQRHKKIGNLAYSSVWEVWKSPHLNLIRNFLKYNGRIKYPCKICNVNGKLRGQKNFEAYI